MHKAIVENIKKHIEGMKKSLGHLESDYVAGYISSLNDIGRIIELGEELIKTAERNLAKLEYELKARV